MSVVLFWIGLWIIAQVPFGMWVGSFLKIMSIEP